jgi:endogenous inhibitor of DNA gyrase (YacG/DUF329 family)
MTAITGRCQLCGQPFTSTAHQRPARRYCCTRCRKRDWRRRRSRARLAPVPHPDDVTAAVPRPRDPTHAAAGAGSQPSTEPNRPATRCPHCAQPVAVISLLVVPAAAHLPTPTTSHEH